MSDSDNIIVGIDIGTTKICALVTKKIEQGKTEILGMGLAPSHGVLRGEVANIDKTVQSIIQAVEEAEKESSYKIKDVYVGIAGQHIDSVQHRGILTREDPESEITAQDVKHLIRDMHRLAMQPGEKIIHVLPQEFFVDSLPAKIDPIGMCGSRLEANFHIITGKIAAAKNIERCIQKAGLNMLGLILEPLASAASVLDEDELEAGVALVDIGGGTTDLAIFQEGIIRHTCVIPFGGNIITEDIKDGCKIMKGQAEQLKLKFGSALAVNARENQIVSIPGIKGRPSKEISMKNLSSIIQARMEEILEEVYFQIKASRFLGKLTGGIVLTGGGSQLKYIKQLVEYVTGLEARIGLPTEHLVKDASSRFKHPMFATGIGLVEKAHKMEFRELGKAKQIIESEEAKKEIEHIDDLEQDSEKVKKKEKNTITPIVAKWWTSIVKTAPGWLLDEDENPEDFK